MRSRSSVTRLATEIPEDLLFGRSERMKQIKTRVMTVAATNVPVLLLGESGTGKEVLAKFIHLHSESRECSFVRVNCPAIPGTLLESELFGYEPGAFTGAYRVKAGLVEAAEKGTLFLDEIAEMDPVLQAKLLHFLQDGTFARLGGQDVIQANVRVISATNRTLEREVQTKAFREDLFYRINVVSLVLPPLRERVADIPDLAEFFVENYMIEYDRRVQPISSKLMELLVHYTWPGNIRELENLIKRHVILGSEDAVATELLQRNSPDHIVADGSKSLTDLTKEAVRELERRIILDVLYANNWNRKRAARTLKISYRTLFYKMKEGGLSKRRTDLRPSAVSSQRSVHDER
jgi:two-component system, NtrC family, response regulator AtoC